MSRHIRVSIELLPEGKGKIQKWGTTMEIPDSLGARERIAVAMSEAAVATISAVMKS